MLEVGGSGRSAWDPPGAPYSSVFLEFNAEHGFQEKVPIYFRLFHIKDRGKEGRSENKIGDV